jgi:hypothetical protein
VRRSSNFLAVTLAGSFARRGLRRSSARCFVNGASYVIRQQVFIGRAYECVCVRQATP